MNRLNSILIEGRIASEITMRSSKPKGKPVATFELGYARKYSSKEAEFTLHVEAWEALAESLAKQATTGRCVRVVGRLEQAKWTSEDGKECQRVKIVAEHVELRPEYTDEIDE